MVWRRAAAGWRWCRRRPHWQRIVLAEQTRTDRVDARSRNLTARKGLAGERIEDRAAERAQIASAHRVGRHRELLRCRRPPAVAFDVGKEERAVVAVVDAGKRERSAETAAKRVERLGRLAVEAIGLRVEGAVLQVLEQAAVEGVRSALRRDRDVA